jgi:phenylalanyl-tRNA synthetase alpha chain
MSADPLAEIADAAQAGRAQLAAADSAEALEAFRIAFLGTKGRVRGLTKLIGQARPEQKKQVGQEVNALRQELATGFEEKQQALSAGHSSEAIDVTEPGTPPDVGHLHVLLRTADELVELFGRMGFDVAAGPEVEDEFHNFVALNIPDRHPARDPLDNFYLDDPTDEPKPGHQRLLRTQTSTVQVRVMKERKPPIRVVIPGRVYRPDTHDDTHLSMFHQLEALVVGEGITMADLKGTVLQFVRGYFGQGTRVRFRASFFPFTEPSAEVDVYFPDRQQWIELGGCGMVHPNVLTTCGIDPQKFSGWAFGFGIERIAMRKYGVSNIRQFVENDQRFLSQF